MQPIKVVKPAWIPRHAKPTATSGLDQIFQDCAETRPSSCRRPRRLATCRADARPLGQGRPKRSGDRACILYFILEAEFLKQPKNSVGLGPLQVMNDDHGVGAPGVHVCGKLRHPGSAAKPREAHYSDIWGHAETLVGHMKLTTDIASILSPHALLRPLIMGRILRIHRFKNAVLRSNAGSHSGARGTGR